MKEYNKPEFSLIEVSCEDVILVSIGEGHDIFDVQDNL